MSLGYGQLLRTRIRIPDKFLPAQLPGYATKIGYKHLKALARVFSLIESLLFFVLFTLNYR